MTTRMQGTLRLRSELGPGVPVVVEAEVGRLKITSGKSVIGDWSSDELSISTSATGLVLDVEGEQLELTIPDRYRLMEIVRGSSDNDPSPLRAKVMAAATASPSRRVFRRSTVLVGATMGLMAIAALAVFTQMGDSRPAATPPPLTNSPSPLPRPVATVAQPPPAPPTTWSVRESDQALWELSHDTWNELLAPAFIRAADLSNAGREGEASVECQLVVEAAEGLQVAAYVARPSDFSRIVRPLSDEFVNLFDLCANGYWDLANEANARVRAYIDKLEAMCQEVWGQGSCASSP